MRATDYGFHHLQAGHSSWQANVKARLLMPSPEPRPITGFIPWVWDKPWQMRHFLIEICWKPSAATGPCATPKSQVSAINEGADVSKCEKFVEIVLVIELDSY